jgi:nitroreductase
MEIHSMITDRWSPVAFSDKPVGEEVILSLFKAARWAPSSFNAQPWRFIMGKRGDETYPVLLDLLSDSNRTWAKTAPVLVLSIAETYFVDRGKENRFALYDTGMAVGNLLIQATFAGLYVHQMGGYDAEKAKGIFKLPEHQTPMAMMAIGYKGDRKQLPEDVAKREDKERVRKELNEFVRRT